MRRTNSLGSVIIKEKMFSSEIFHNFQTVRKQKTLQCSSKYRSNNSKVVGSFSACARPGNYIYIYIYIYIYRVYKKN